MNFIDKFFYAKRSKKAYSKLPAELIDGALVTEGLLERGVDLQFLPRQMIVGRSDRKSTKTVGFTHGVPGSSTLAGVTFLADRRVRRALLQKHGVDVPEGATFSYQSKLDVVKYVRRIGYPLVVKEAMAQTLGENGTIVKNLNELEAEIGRIRVVDESFFNSESDYKNAAYAITGLLPTVQSESGAELKNERHRFLLEKHETGYLVRLIVIHGRVMYAMHRPSGAVQHIYTPLKKPEYFEVVGQQVMNALAGINTLCIDIVVKDIDKEVSGKDYIVVEVNERLHLHDVITIHPWDAKQITNRLVVSELNAGGINYKNVKSSLELNCLAKGLVDPNEFKAQMIEFIKGGDIEAVVQWGEIEMVKGEVGFELKGGVCDLSYLLNVVSAGLNMPVRPMSIDVSQS
ncbi:MULTISPECIES: ATP-binding protein [unclassified Halomonas]|uniref:ATP-binding protein n=1 Tax=unclassified Halomonas TaxID=2609666 RepID=UPI0009909959|nr:MULTISPECIES: hypothetical protein [unclassified Halomonas]AQU81875.1 hypothetical protein B2G49_04235 [Halomonas sp. 'Soap Lake \